MAGAVRSEAYQKMLRGIVELRKDANLSQADLAARVGKPPSFVGKYELGERRLDVIELFVIVTAMGMSPITFLEVHIGELPKQL